MKNRTWMVLAVTAIAVVVAGGLYASNMGFKLNYQLAGPADSESGTNTLALPYNAQVGITMASDLRADIGTDVAGITRYNTVDDGTTTYPPDDFPIVAGEGYRVAMSNTVDYIIVGSHDPALVITLFGPGGASASGTNDYAYPYHSVAQVASELRDEIDAASSMGAVSGITRYLPGTDGTETYPPDEFNLTPGESYRIAMTSTANFVPAHF